MITSSALLGRKGQATLPVACVEQGRWGREAQFRGSSSAAPASLRRIIKQTVTSSLLDHGGRAADQARIWSAIAEQQHRLHVTSATSALEASYVARADDLRPSAARLPYAPRATGLAIGIGGELVSIDLFDKPQTCEAYWRQLVDGAMLEALGADAARRGRARCAGPGGGGGQRRPGRGGGAGGAAARRGVAAGAAGGRRRGAARAGRRSLGVGADRRRLRDPPRRGRGAGARIAAEADAPRAAARAGRSVPDLARLGVGGVKEVFRAADLRGGPDVAIARVPYASRERIASEADLARRVQGPYVPRIHEAFIDELDDGYIVMELCVGPSLAEVARRPLTVAEAGPILVEMRARCGRSTPRTCCTATSSRRTCSCARRRRASSSS